MTIDTVSSVERGWLGLNYSSGSTYGYVNEDNRPEFVFPNSIRTFQYMAQDPVIAAANNIIDIMIGKSEWKFEAPEGSDERVQAATDYLNWCMVNMEETWSSFIEEVGSYRIYGFHVSEKVWEQNKDGEYAGKFKWKSLRTRSQSTISGWKFDKKVRTLKNIFQSTSGLPDIYGLTTAANGGQIKLPANKCLLFSYKKRKGNPEGHSPLKDCFQPWTYKKTIESYEAVGVAKDLGGVPVMFIDATWLSKAQSDATSDEAKTLATLQTYAENLHSGNQTYMFMPMAYNEAGKPLFDFKLIGVDGGGKQYNTRDIINGKQLEILMIYLADVLKLGSESHGSFALAENKNNLLSFGIEHHLQFMSDVIDNDLVPQTLAVNGWADIPKEKMPKLTYTDLDQVDIDNLSKLVQRLGSVNFLPRTKETVNEILEKAGFKYQLSDEDIEGSELFTANTLYPELFTENESGASEGMEEGSPSGTGNATGGGDSSVSNKENT
ncbi:MAG: hypothetical protein GY799_21375 [Desulfobulbaceae bacterium]|nr:hypothetical protein [Desulfobulbaceae bacterium]